MSDTITNRSRFFQSNRISLSFIAFVLFIFLSLPSIASAHNYSASFTDLKIEKDKTSVTFSIDTISLIELISGLDKNKNYILEKSEIKEGHHKLEEVITEAISLDKNNHELTPTLEKMKLVKKSNSEFLRCTISYDGFSPGDTINFNDGFYSGDSGTTNYVDLLTATFGAETSQAALQGTSRDWTMLLTDDQQEQQSTDGQTIDQSSGQGQPKVTITPKKTSHDISSWYSFFKLGILHILTGYDHLLFLFALLITRQKLKQYIGTVTAFTIAHCITLSLAVFGLINVSSRIVEPIIALSICYVALENMFKEKINKRWVITFIFGLIHGLGFASLLIEMNLPKPRLAVALLNFNLGIEFIQLLIVLLLIPILLKLQKLSDYRKYVRFGSVLIFILGFIWLIQRII